MPISLFRPAVLFIGLFGSSLLLAQGLPKAEYIAAQQALADDYQVAKRKCEALSGHASDLCVVDAKSGRMVAKAELEASYQPSARNHYRARLAKAEGDYSMAKERCNEKSGSAKSICVQEAKSLVVAAKADAVVQMKTREANAQAKSSGEDARKDAKEEKMNAGFAVAKEKCDALVGAAQERCMSDAQVRFGKQ